MDLKIKIELIFYKTGKTTFLSSFHKFISKSHPEEGEKVF